MLGTRRGGCFSLLDAEVFWEDGTAPSVCVKKHEEGEFLFDDHMVLLITCALF